MDKREIKKFIKNEFKDICKEYDFFHLTDNVIVKVTQDNVLWVICFELADFGITCSVAIQPLYIFDRTPGVVSLNMGARLSRFKTRLPEWWESGNIEVDLQEIKYLLLKNGIPWFQQYGNPKGIIDFIKKGKSKEYGFHQFQVYGEKEYLGYSLLYIGKIAEGIERLEELANKPLSPHAALSWREYIQDLLNLINTLKQDQSEIPAIIDKLIIKNKKALKIDIRHKIC
jgi:hypothetical protein